MDYTLIWQGVIVGVTLAAAFGPIALLCIQRTLANGWVYGFASGLGVAAADGLYGFIGGLGLTMVTELLVGQQLWLRLAGGLFLGYLGVHIFLSRPTLESTARGGSHHTERPGYLAASTSIFLLTLTNPITILAFAAIYAEISFQALNTGLGAASSFGLGVFFGSASWWAVLTAGANVLRDRLNLVALRWVNRVSGVLIFGFGLFILLDLL